MPTKIYTFQRDKTVAGFLAKHRPIAIDAYIALAEAVDTNRWKLIELTDPDADRPKIALEYSNDDEYEVFKRAFARRLNDKGLIVAEIEVE